MNEVFGNSNCCNAPILEPCDDGFGRCSECGDMASNVCETCDAHIVKGIPKYDPKTSQRMKCTDFHIKGIMDKIKNIKENR